MKKRKKTQFLQNLDDFHSFGQRLQCLRIKKGLTQQELAEKIGVSRSAIHEYEADRTRISDKAMFDIATVLQVSADDILGLKTPERETPPVSLRLAKRMAIIESLPEATKKQVLRTLDDSIKANTANAAPTA